jgi:flagellar basal-body rod protein FlgC
VVLEAQDGRDSFRNVLARSSLSSNAGYNTAGGVRVTEIAEDPSDLKLMYDPTHPDANENGYVELPNVTLVKEVTDAMAATQAYSAGVTALNSLKTVINQALEIGR